MSQVRDVVDARTAVLPSTLPVCVVRVLGRPRWFDPNLLTSVRIRPATVLVKLISNPRTTGMAIAATTIGHTIYFHSPAYFRPEQPGGLALLAHELRHVEQYQERGGLIPFSVAYLREFLRGGYGANISFEAEAMNVQRVVHEHLTREFAYNFGNAPCVPGPAGPMSSLQYSFLYPYPDLPREPLM